MKRVPIPPEGLGLSESAQLGWRGEPPTGRPAGPILGPGSGTFGKSEGREQLNHERPARACQASRAETVPDRERPTPAGNRALLDSARRNRYRRKPCPGGSRAHAAWGPWGNAH